MVAQVPKEEFASCGIRSLTKESEECGSIFERIAEIELELAARNLIAADRADARA